MSDLYIRLSDMPRQGIKDSSVSNNKLASMSANTIKGAGSEGSAPKDLQDHEIRDILGVDPNNYITKPQGFGDIENESKVIGHDSQLVDLPEQADISIISGEFAPLE